MSEWIGGCALACIEMVEDENGLYRQGEMKSFCSETVERDGTCDSEFATHEEAIRIWVQWMENQGYEVYALPSTPRTRDWGCGSLYSVTPADEDESKVFSLLLDHLDVLPSGSLRIN